VPFPWNHWPLINNYSRMDRKLTIRIQPRGADPTKPWSSGDDYPEWWVVASSRRPVKLQADIHEENSSIMMNAVGDAPNLCNA